MNWARHTWWRAGVARSLIHGVGQKRAACSAILPVPYCGPPQLPVFNFLAHHLLHTSAFSSGSANIFNGHAAAMAEGQQAVAKPGPLFQYQQKVESGDLMAGDKNQERSLKALQALYDELMEKADAMGLEESASSIENRPRSWFWTSFLSKSQRTSNDLVVRGLYLYGGVGTGKTMLMDMFYEELPEKWRKRRTHFHDFMLNVHSRLKKQQGKDDPLQAVAEELSNETILTCLDEFMVTDVADALILNRLFGHLFKRGVVLVTTSNRAPDQLYEGGLQRDLFLPFIDLLKKRCIVHEIGSAVDYRKLNLNEEGFYFCGEESTDLLRERFRIITDGNLAKPAVVEVVMGRKLQVPFAANGCAYFQFHELCETPLGAADYIGLLENFHTVALEGVPVFGSHNRVSAYRFVTLVDVMYDHKGRLLCSAEAEPTELFKRVIPVAEAPKASFRARRNDDADLCVDNELGFVKERTISRLTEMNSKPYLEEHAKLITRRNHLGEKVH